MFPLALLNSGAPASTATTTILMPFTTTSQFTDTVGGHAITQIGTPTISTVQSRFGAGALRITPNNYLRIDTAAALNVDSLRPFTFEFWVYREQDMGSYQGDGLLSMRTGGNRCPVAIKTQYTYVGNASLDGWYFLSGANNTQAWVHYALVGDGVNIKSYKGGVLVNTIPHPSWSAGNQFFNIGYDANGGANAYINDLRISDGARYTTNFTPPTAPFTY